METGYENKKRIWRELCVKTQCLRGFHPAFGSRIESHNALAFCDYTLSYHRRLRKTQWYQRHFCNSLWKSRIILTKCGRYFRNTAFSCEAETKTWHRRCKLSFCHARSLLRLKSNLLEFDAYTNRKAGGSGVRLSPPLLPLALLGSPLSRFYLPRHFYGKCGSLFRASLFFARRCLGWKRKGAFENFPILNRA